MDDKTGMKASTTDASSNDDRTIQDGLTAPAVKPPARPTGPNASAIVVGLVAIFLSGLIIAKETMSLHVDWSRLGPGAIVGIGVVMVAIGATGLVRRRDHG